MKRLKIYVAGPITSRNPTEYKRNIKLAKQIGEKLFKKGHYVYVQHTLFAFWDIDLWKDYDHIMEHGYQIIREWADALFYIGSSKGADMELELAKKLGLKIFTDLSQVEDVNESKI